MRPGARAALAAAVLCALTACAHRKPASLAIDRSLEALIPADAVFILGANIDAIKNTPAYQKLLGQLDLPQLNQFTRETGLDPRRDLSQVISVSDGKTALLAARGNFGKAGIESRLEAQGARRFAYKRYTLFGYEGGAVSFINSSTAVAGPAAAVRQALDNLDGKAGGLRGELRKQVQALPATNQIWAALVGGLQGLNLGIPEGSPLGNVVGVLRGIETARLGVDLRSGLNLDAAATCTTERDAKRVRDTMAGVIGIGRLSTPDNRPDLLKLYDAVEVKQAGAVTGVSVRIPRDLADQFIDMWTKTP